MLTLKGKFLAKVGDSGGDCSGPDLSVPPICTECRQVKRWTSKMLMWAKTQPAKFQALAKSILQADDDILAALCGFCYLQPIETCECFLVKYQALGLPLTVPVWTGDRCAPIGTCETMEICGSESDWFIVCQEICNECVPRTLDPCGSETDFAITQNIYNAVRIANRNANTGPALIETLEALFPSSAPQIVKIENRTIWVWIGRDFTDEEFQLRQYYKTLLPVNKGSKIVFTWPCQ